jgi:hypothetical protein
MEYDVIPETALDLEKPCVPLLYVFHQAIFDPRFMHKNSENTCASKIELNFMVLVEYNEVLPYM